MHLETSFVVPHALQRVWDFMSDPMKQLVWDRSAHEVIVTSQGPIGVGFTYRTIGPPRKGRPGLVTSYRVKTFEPPVHAEIEVVDSSLFASAVWGMRFEELGPASTRVFWSMDMRPKLRYLLLGPILRASIGNLERDRDWFIEALDAEYGSQPVQGPRHES